MATDRSKERMLPGDFSKWCKTNPGRHYGQVDDVDKAMTRPSEGMFTFPEDFEGEQNVGVRDFLVFYFDLDKASKRDYEFVRSVLERPNSKARSHPDLDPRKLARLLRKALDVEEPDDNEEEFTPNLETEPEPEQPRRRRRC